jgi:transcriptional regulator NrdR family protein
VNCPKCGSRSRARSGYRYRKIAAMRRRRTCTNSECQHRFETTELAAHPRDIAVRKGEVFEILWP